MTRAFFQGQPRRSDVLLASARWALKHESYFTYLKIVRKY